MINRSLKYIFDKNEYDLIQRECRYVYVSEKKSNVIKVNETGMFIIGLLDGEHTVNDVLDQVSENYKLATNIIEEHVINFFDSLLKNNFIHTNEEGKERESSVEYLGVNRVHLNLNQLNTLGKLEELSFDKIKGIFEKIEDGNVGKIVSVFLKGYEPCIHSNFNQIIDYLAGKKYANIVLETNLRFQDATILEKIQDKPGMLVFNICNSEKEENDKLMYKGHYEFLINTVKKMVNQTLQVYFGVQSKRDNLDTLNGIQQLGYKLHMNGIYLYKERDIDEKKRERWEDQKKELVRDNMFMNNWKNNRIKNNSNRFKLFFEEQFCINTLSIGTYRRHHCGFGIEELSVDTDGSIYPCHMFHQEAYRYKDIDDFMQHSFNTNKDKVADKCKSCRGWIFCNGGCKYDNYLNHREFNEPLVSCDMRLKVIDNYIFV